MEEFLSRLTMTVWKDGKQIYQASPDELDGLEKNVLLGSFAKGESAKLTVELQVPSELDDRFANRVGEVDWVFTAEQVKNSEPESSGSESPGPPPRSPPPAPLLTAASLALTPAILQTRCHGLCSWLLASD